MKNIKSQNIRNMQNTKNDNKTIMLKASLICSTVTGIGSQANIFYFEMEVKSQIHYHFK